MKYFSVKGAASRTSRPGTTIMSWCESTGAGGSSRHLTFYYFAPLEKGFVGRPQAIDIHGNPA